jgi:phenylacetate-CoA ligase
VKTNLGGRLAPVALDDILDFAVRHVPYYQEFRGCRSLVDFPLLTKDTIRRDIRRLLSDDLERRRWQYDTSGGSTGEPVRFVQDDEYLRRVWRATVETKRWTGYRPGDPLLKLWARKESRVVPKGLKAALGRWVANTILLNTFFLDEQIIDEYVAIIRRFSPQLIVGSASSLYTVSKQLLERGDTLDCIGAVTSTDSTLFPEMRHAIEQAFGCRVFDRYGSSEVSIIAAEDGENAGLRIAPTVYVETLRPDGTRCNEGEIGEIAVTSLANFAMPLIRFKIGDVGAIRTETGRPYLVKLQGRTIQFFKTIDRKLIDGEYLVQGMFYRDWVQKFRFRQISYDRMVIEVVIASQPPPCELQEVESRVKGALGENSEVEWRFVDEIPPLPSGKYLYTLCEIL